MSILDHFLVSFWMVLASIWLPEPSRRPSRRHYKKTSNFDTPLLVVFRDLGDLLGPSKLSKNITMHLHGGPILAPKADWEKNEVPRWYFNAFWLPKFVFWRRFLSFFCIFLGSRSSNSIRHRPPTTALAEQASQSCICQISFPMMYLAIKRLNQALGK